MIALSLAEIADATGGRLDAVPDASAMVTGPVVSDSRAVEPGALFVAVPGERVDGHDFVDEAVHRDRRAGRRHRTGARRTGQGCA